MRTREGCTDLYMVTDAVPEGQEVQMTLPDPGNQL